MCEQWVGEERIERRRFDLEGQIHKKEPSSLGT